MEHLYLHHILHFIKHCQARIQFKAGTKIIDVGTGGRIGSALPLAIMFPECSFLLVDSIGKKIKVVEEIITSLGITNAFALNERARKY